MSLASSTLRWIITWALSVGGPTVALLSCKVFDPSLVEEGAGSDDDDGATCTPTEEVCNGLDDDCDNDIDEGFSLADDVDNCGECGRACTFAHASGECADGTCANACESGWKDCNDNDVDGCEANLASKSSCGDCRLTCPFSCSATTCVTGAAVAAGRTWSCLALSSGGVRCWGNNEHGQLGSGDTESTAVPRDVVGLDDATQLAVGFGHSCALRGDRIASCWGQNDRGQVGDGTTAQRTAPVPVVLADIDDIAVGLAHTCARSGVKLYCWGFNDAGQLGQGDEVNRPLPTLVPEAVTGDVVDIAIGLSHTCAVRSTGDVICFGFNDQGQTGVLPGGQGGSDHVLDPVVVPGIGDATEISLGHAHSCVRTSTGGVRCWGWNGSGQLGDGTFFSRTEPRDVVDEGGAALTGIERVIAGPIRTCALTAKGEAFCWGDNTDGALGAGSDAAVEARAQRVTIDDLPVILDIAVGERHTCFLGGVAVRCMGDNTEGQLGDGSTAASRTGVDVSL